jgi:DNA-binding transcriptional ArsR family regulator
MQTTAVAEDLIFQALADPSRRAIFESLTRREAAVKDLTVPSGRSTSIAWNEARRPARENP